MGRFEFCKKFRGVTYVYCSEDQILCTRDDSAGERQYDRRHMSEKQALTLLEDIVSGTVEPLENYFRAVEVTPPSFGRDGAGACPRCGHREV